MIIHAKLPFLLKLNESTMALYLGWSLPMISLNVETHAWPSLGQQKLTNLLEWAFHEICDLTFVLSSAKMTKTDPSIPWTNLASL